MYLCALVVWEKRSIPLYWLLLDKKGSSNIGEQQALITPVLELLSDYEVIILGEREFGSAKWVIRLCHKQVKFILRVKEGLYIQSSDSDYILLSDLVYFQKLLLVRRKSHQAKRICHFW